MLITMLADRFLAGGVLCAKGTQVDVATEQALRWIGDNVAAPVGLARETAQGIRRDVPVLQDQIGGQQSAAGAPVSGAGIAYATLASTPGAAPGDKRTLTDGPDAGAQVVWAIPEGSTSYAWCWAIYPLASYL